MTTFVVALLTALITATACAFELMLGGAGLLTPSAGLVMVALVGRRAPSERTRVVAVVAGLVAGSLVEGGVFALPVAYVLLGHLALGARRAIPMETVLGLGLWGMGLALLEALILAAFRVPGRLHTISDGAAPWLWALAGIATTGICFAAGEVLVTQVPRLRHGIERP